MTHGCNRRWGRARGDRPVPHPVKSGLPSGPRGAGAVRSGLPSAVRGMSGVFRSSHWAMAGGVVHHQSERREKQPHTALRFSVRASVRWPDGSTLNGLPLARNRDRPELVNFHEVRRHSLVVDDELIADAQPFEQRLTSRDQRSHLTAVDGCGADDFGD